MKFTILFRRLSLALVCGLLCASSAWANDLISLEFNGTPPPLPNKFSQGYSLNMKAKFQDVITSGWKVKIKFNNNVIKTFNADGSDTVTGSYVVGSGSSEAIVGLKATHRTDPYNPANSNPSPTIPVANTVPPNIVNGITIDNIRPVLINTSNVNDPNYSLKVIDNTHITMDYDETLKSQANPPSCFALKINGVQQSNPFQSAVSSGSKVTLTTNSGIQFFQGQTVDLNYNCSALDRIEDEALNEGNKAIAFVYLPVQNNAPAAPLPQLLKFTTTTGAGNYGPGISFAVTAHFDAPNFPPTATQMKVRLSTGEEVTFSTQSGSTLLGTYVVGPTTPGVSNQIILKVTEIIVDINGQTVNQPVDPSLCNLDKNTACTAETIRNIDRLAPICHGNIIVNVDQVQLTCDEGMRSGVLNAAQFQIKIGAGGTPFSPDSASVASSGDTQIKLILTNPVNFGEDVFVKYDPTAPYAEQAKDVSQSVNTASGGNFLSAFDFVLALNQTDSNLPELDNFQALNINNGTYGPTTEITISAHYDEDLNPDESWIKVKLNNGVELTLDAVDGSAITAVYKVGPTGSAESIADPLVVGMIIEQHAVDLQGNLQNSTILPLTNIYPNKSIRIDTTAPEIESASISGDSIDVNFNDGLQPLSIDVDTKLEFSVTTDGVPNPVNEVELVGGTGGHLKISVDNPISLLSEVKLSYHVDYWSPDPAPPQGQTPVQDDALTQGNPLADFTDYIVSAGLSVDPIIVNTKWDDFTDGNGSCSLREAIENANLGAGGDESGGDCGPGHVGGDVIRFQDVYTITPSGVLPTITSPVMIDAFLPSTNCASHNVGILIKGDLINSNYGLRFSGGADASIIQGLAIGNFHGAGGGIMLESGSITLYCNNIGANQTGLTSLSNGTGIFIKSSSNNINNNLISSNSSYEIRIDGFGITGGSNNVIDSNLIGPNAAGDDFIIDSLAGILIGLGSSNVVTNNTIKGNETGILVANSSNTINFSTKNTFRHNQVFDNDQLGIDLAFGNSYGVTPNDALPVVDGDIGPNDLLNYPVIIDLVAVGSDLHVQYKLPVHPDSGTCQVEFFSNSAPDSTGHGEGEVFLKAVSVTPDPDPEYVYEEILDGAANATYITATVTDEQGSTSEFAKNRTGGDKDFGDAPDSSSGTSPDNYNTVSSDQGASHVVGPLYMGNCADGDNGSLQNLLASADDANTGTILSGTCAIAGDDEDGISFLNIFIEGNSGTIRVKSSGPGYVNVWFDWNSNGNWTDAGEHKVVNKLVAVGTTTIFINLPSNSGGKRFMRARLSSASGLSPTGPALDGEVEDYRVTIIDVVDPEICCKESFGGEGDEQKTEKWNPAGERR